MIQLDRMALMATTTFTMTRWTHYPDGDLHKLSGLVGPGDVCVDVGSSYGLYCQALSHLVGPEGLVHSIEPVSFSHPLLSRVFGTRNLPNVRHHQVALGPEPGQGTMRVPYRGRGGRRSCTGRSFLDWRTHGLGSNAEFAYHADVPVKVETLDRLFDDGNGESTRVDFVKIDVEGGELHVLHGGERIIENFQPTIFMELEERHTDRYGYSPDDVVQWLADRGYGMFVWRHGWQRVDKVTVQENNYLFRSAA